MSLFKRMSCRLDFLGNSQSKDEPKYPLSAKRYSSSSSGASLNLDSNASSSSPSFSLKPRSLSVTFFTDEEDDDGYGEDGIFGEEGEDVEGCVLFFEDANTKDAGYSEEFDPGCLPEQASSTHSTLTRQSLARSAYALAKQQDASPKGSGIEQKCKRKKDKYSHLNSVPLDKFKSALQRIGGGAWGEPKGPGGPIRVWEISKTPKWDFHLSVCTDDNVQNVTKFHFTLRDNTTGDKRESAYAWYEISGHDQHAVLKKRDDKGNLSLFSHSSLDPVTRQHIANIDTYAKEIFSRVMKFLKKG